MLSLLRYTASRCALSQVWVPPWIAFVLLIAVSYPSNAGALGSMSLGIVFLLVVSTWIGWATTSTESAAQSASLAAVGRGLVSHRLTLLLAATLASFMLVPLSVGWAMANDPAGLTAIQLAVAVGAHVVSGVTGVAVGAVVSRPLVSRTGFSFLLAALILVVLVAAPGLPVRLVIHLLNAPHLGPRDLTSTLLTVLATMAGAVVICWGSAVMARLRA